MNWFIDSGLVHKVSRVTEHKMPLKAYEDVSSYKLFLLDVGLLSAMNQIDVKSLLENDKLFNDYNGSITEQHVLRMDLEKKYGVIMNNKKNQKINE